MMAAASSPTLDANSEIWAPATRFTAGERLSTGAVLTAVSTRSADRVQWAPAANLARSALSSVPGPQLR